MGNNNSASRLAKKKFGHLAVQFSVKLVSMLLVLFVIQGVFIVRTVRNSTKQDYSDFSSKVIGEDAGKIQNWNDVLVNDLRIYSDNDVTKTGDTDRILGWLLSHESIKNPLFNYIVFCTPDGVGHSSDGKTITVISKPFFRSIMKDGKDHFVSNIDFQLDGTVCYYIARPAYDASGALIGVFAGAVKLDEIDKMIGELSMGKAGRAILVGSNGVLISHMHGQAKYMDLSYSDKAGFSGLTDIARHACAGETGEGYYVDPNGVRTFSSFVPVPGTPWTAILTIPLWQIDEAGNSLRAMIIAINIIIGILVALAGIVFLFIAIQPLRVVRNSINQIASGDADLTQHVVVKSNNEIGALGEGFNIFMTKLRTIVSGVKESKTMLETVNIGLQDRIEENGKSIQEIIYDLNDIGAQVQSQAASVSETASAVEEISKNIESLEHMIETQSSGVTQASAAVEEMIGNIRSVNVSVGHMAGAVENASGREQDDFGDCVSDESSGDERGNRGCPCRKRGTGILRRRRRNQEAFDNVVGAVEDDPRGAQQDSGRDKRGRERVAGFERFVCRRQQQHQHDAAACPPDSKRDGGAAGRLEADWRGAQTYERQHVRSARGVARDGGGKQGDSRGGRPAA